MKDNTYHKINIVLKALLYISMIIAAVLFGVLISNSLQHKSMFSNWNRTTELSFDGEYSIDGGSWENTDTFENNDTNFKHVVFRGNFSKEIPLGQIIFLYPEQCYVSITLNGEELASVKQVTSFFNSTGAGWLEIISPGITEHDVIEMTVSPCFENQTTNICTSFLENIKTGTGDALYHDMLTRRSHIIVISFFVFSMGLCSVIVAAIERRHKLDAAGSIAAFGFVSIAGGLWVFIDGVYYYITLILPYPLFCSLLDLCVSFLLPIAVSFSILQAVKSRAAKIISKIGLIYKALLFILFLSLQMLGIRDIYEVMPWVIISLSLPVFVALPMFFIEIRRYNNTPIIAFVISYIPMYIGIFLEAVNHYYFEFTMRRICAPVGITITCIIRIYYIIDLVRKSAEQKRKMESEIMDNRVSIMLSQIQPHFLYNALSTIRELCHSNPALAEKATIDFTDFLRGNMDSLKSDKPIPFKQELAHTQNYISLEKLRFTDSLEIIYEINTTDFCLPTLTLQPIVENAVRYGATKRETGGGIVKISTYESTEGFIIVVEDNGSGFDPMAKKNDGRTHVGIKNVSNRLEKMCQGSLNIKSTAGKGTVAVITLPKKEKINADNLS